MHIAKDAISIFKKKVPEYKEYTKCLALIEQRIPGWMDITLPVQAYCIPDAAAEGKQSINNAAIPLVYQNYLSEAYWKVPLTSLIGFRLDTNKQLIQQNIPSYLYKAAKGEIVTTPVHTMDAASENSIDGNHAEKHTIVCIHSPVRDYSDQTVRAVLTHNLDIVQVAIGSANGYELYLRMKGQENMNRQLLYYNRILQTTL